MDRIKFNSYRHVFFDLDDTIWDFKANSKASLRVLFDQFELGEKSGWDFENYFSAYHTINEKLWTLYMKNLVTRDQIRIRRFEQMLLELNLHNNVDPREMSEVYLADCPRRKTLVPGAKECLDLLKNSGFKMHVITNGFEGVQQFKISNSGLSSYFDFVITSDGSGSKKPSTKIFKLALAGAGAKIAESIMIGDSIQSDIEGARSFGMDHLYFNKDNQKETHQNVPQFTHFDELNAYLRG